MKKRLIAVLLAMLMIASLMACANKEEVSKDASSEPVSEPSTTEEVPAENKESGEVKEVVIAEAFNLMDDNVTNIYNGIEDAVAAYNEAHPDVHVTNIHTDAQGSLDKQIADIESLVVQQPDAMYVLAVDVEGTAPAAQAAQNEGIKIVDMMGMPYGVDVRFNGFAEYDAGLMVCEWLDKYFEENPEKVLHAAVLNGSQANTAQIQRLEAVREYAEAHPERLEILVDYYGDWTTDDAMNVTEDWLQTYDNLNAVFAASDQVALGVCNVVESNGLTGEFIITGFDGTESGLSLVESGKMTMTIAMDMEKYSTNLTELLIQLALGEYEGDTYDGTGVLTAVDQSNLEEWRAK